MAQWLAGSLSDSGVNSSRTPCSSQACKTASTGTKAARSERFPLSLGPHRPWSLSKAFTWPLRPPTPCALRSVPALPFPPRPLQDGSVAELLRTLRGDVRQLAPLWPQIEALHQREAWSALEDMSHRQPPPAAEASRRWHSSSSSAGPRPR